MASDDDPNPYTPTPASPLSSPGAEDDSPTGLTDDDLKDLRVGARRAKERAARFEPYILPAILLLMAIYQFWMCWTVSQSSGASFAELLSHDGAGFPADSYDGGLVRMFDRFATGFCVLIVGGFMYFMARTERKRDLQNARFHDTMFNAGLVPPDPKSTKSQAGG